MENASLDTEEPPHSDADIQRRLGSLYEEYRALYGLVIFRMTSLDRRVPIAGATLTATLAAVGSMPLQAMPVIFFGLPLALLWFLRATINHALAALPFLAVRDRPHWRAQGQWTRQSQ